MTERRVIDWESIERDYRAGVLTLRALASQHGISEGAIRLKAKKEDWPRDLSAKIAAKVDDLLRKKELRNNYATEKESVANTAQMQADYIFSSRKDISKQEEITQRLVEELETCGDELGEKVKINKALAETRKILIGLQRQALNIQDGSLPAGDAAIETIRRLIVRPDNG
jgi:hypothetical protein